MEKKEIQIHNRCCRVYGGGNVKYVLVQPVDEHDLEALDGEVDRIVEAVGNHFLLVAYPIEEWMTELSPWSAPPVFGRQPFGDGAANTLRTLTEKVIPTLQQQFMLDVSPLYIIGGYSLAGLFALWVGYESKQFQAVVAASPSVWFLQWMDFAESHLSNAKAVYLSLGDREEHTRNRQMALVGDCVRRQYELYQRQTGLSSILEWNSGNHFQQSDERTAKGFIWALKQLSAAQG
uniref:Esterase n=1 Tax=Prevotella sp. GTC17253 TaxID=3236793 RepID=A0AB33IYH7_9BACT